jgi:hypothetical protein
VSIYATLWHLRFPSEGDLYPDSEWVDVLGQAVPGHIGSPTPGHGYEKGDPYGDFLPPPIEVGVDEWNPPNRAVVIVRAGTPKDGQRYTDPLVVLSGHEYEESTFGALYERICDALRGDRPRLLMGAWGPGGVRLMFEDGSSRSIPPEEISSVSMRDLSTGDPRAVMPRLRDDLASIRTLLDDPGGAMITLPEAIGLIDRMLAETEDLA